MNITQEQFVENINNCGNIVMPLWSIIFLIIIIITLTYYCFRKSKKERMLKINSGRLVGKCIE
jgi:hypothetical protein